MTYSYKDFAQMFILHVDNIFLFRFEERTRGSNLYDTCITNVRVSFGLPCNAPNKLNGKLILLDLQESGVSYTNTISFPFHKIAHPSPRIKTSIFGKEGRD